MCIFLGSVKYFVSSEVNGKAPIGGLKVRSTLSIQRTRAPPSMF